MTNPEEILYNQLWIVHSTWIPYQTTWWNAS